MRSITVYTDYKSPYAYLAKDLAYELERDFPVRLEWLPYVLDIPSFLGSARVDADGSVLEENRNAHQWRRVRYSYMDCRRQARKRGLVIRGPQKIWDSTLAAAGMLYAQRAGDAVFRRYHDAVFERFWRRELDIEDAAVIAAVLAEAGADGAGVRRAGAGRAATRWRRSAAPRKRSACSACRVSSSMASCSGAASICPTSARCWRRDQTNRGKCHACRDLSQWRHRRRYHRRSQAGRRPGAGEDAVLRHLRHRPARGEVHRSSLSNARAAPADAGRWIPRATWCSAMNSAARSSSTARPPRSG